MRILITGGTGLIGKHLTPELIESGHEVVILTRKSAHTTGHVHHVHWNGKVIPDSTGPADVVINLAGASIIDHPWTKEYKKLIRTSRVQCTQACVDYIKRQNPKPRVFLSGSAVGFYGTQNPRHLDETAPPGKDFLARTGIEWENLAKAAPVRTVLLRTGVVMARDGGAFPRLLTPFKFYAGGYLGSGKQGFPWIHIDDVVGMIRWAIDNDEVEGPLNVVAPETLNNRDFGRVVGRIIHKPAGLPVPALVVKAMLGERSMILLEGQFVVPKKAQDLGYTFRYPTAEAAVMHMLDKEEDE